MRIGIFDPYLDDLGGGEKYMMTIAECLSSENKVDVFWDNKEDITELLKRFTLDLSRVNIVPNIFSYHNFFKKILETRKYDVIIFLSDGSIPFSLAKRLFIHLQSPMGRRIKKNLKTKIKMGRVTKFFCNSAFTKSYIDKELAIKCSVIYPPIKIKSINLEKENIILHVGRFRVKNVRVGDYKKQGLMVESFKRLKTEDSNDWRFVLAISVREKDKEAFEDLKKKAKGLPIEFLVNKSNEELWEIYSKAKIYWHASGYGEDLQKHPEFAEHFGISTVEAMGVGAVPIVINAGGQREIVEDGKSGFLWSDLDDLIKKTVLLIKNEKLLREMSKEAKFRAQFFAEGRFCNDLNQILYE